MEKEQEVFLFNLESFIRVLIPFVEAEPSKFTHLNTVALVVTLQHAFWKGHHHLSYSIILEFV
jgi:hypothetical protein